MEIHLDRPVSLFIDEITNACTVNLFAKYAVYFISDTHNLRSTADAALYFDMTEIPCPHEPMHKRRLIRWEGSCNSPSVAFGNGLRERVSGMQICLIQ